MSEVRVHTIQSDENFLKATALNIQERLECDTVHIFMTRHNARKDVTELREIGVGNTLARQKQIEEWVRFNNQIELIGGDVDGE